MESLKVDKEKLRKNYRDYQARWYQKRVSWKSYSKG